MSELVFGDENELSKKIRECLGVGDYETVKVTLPQFDRVDGRKVYYFPKTIEEFDNLKKAPPKTLKDIGLGRWDEETWLYPSEWYDYIPDGYEVVDINGEKEKFKPGVTDDDRRCGCLSYGFIRTKNNDSAPKEKK